MSSKETIFDGCKTILTKQIEGLFEYNTDTESDAESDADINDEFLFLISKSFTFLNIF